MVKLVFENKFAIIFNRFHFSIFIMFGTHKTKKYINRILINSKIITIVVISFYLNENFNQRLYYLIELIMY